jgi:hypothetical protein
VLQFIVLGEIPGTNTQIDFTLLLNIFLGLIGSVLLLVLARRAMRRYMQKKVAFIRLELISL